MKYKFGYILFFIILSSYSYGQDNNQSLTGKVSFVTSKSVYVKFASTENIKLGDTLQISTTKTPCLLVTNKSSNSVVCSIISNCNIQKGTEVLHNVDRKIKIIPDKENKEPAVERIDKKEYVDEKKSMYSENIKGKLSVAGYSTLSSIRDNRHRLVSRFSLNAEHINNSKFSFESYLNYRKNFITEDPDFPRKTEFFNIYNLSIRYDIDPTLSVIAGRKINPKASSLGAIDGLQVEKYFGNNYVGLIGGFRPDFFDYGFNSDLLEYGAYFGRVTDFKNFYSETTLGLLEQQNNGKIDRRYTYFQHSSTLFKKLHLFSSLELDIYNKVNDTVNNDIRLTNLYASARYRFNRNINATLSYDSRKRIIYYETFQTDIERLLDDDIARQGVRMRINLRPSDYVNAGFSYSKRFQNNQDNKSDNIYVYLGLSKIPGIGGRASLNYNINTSNYLESNILSLRYSRPFFNDKLYADFYYRFVNYTYLSSNVGLSNPTLVQHYYGTNLSYHISRSLTLSVSGELSTTKLENNYRIYTKLAKRFNKKRKKKL